MNPELFTIGVYGSDEATFFATLQAAQIDTFCDIRRRRGMRGSLYAFANSARLQQRLAELGINYRYIKELAPGEELRARQQAEDKRLKIAKRTRQGLGEDFATAYREQQLATLDPAAILGQFGPEARRVALFCVEREPQACHRSIAAAWLRDELGLSVTDLKP